MIEQIHCGDFHSLVSLDNGEVYFAGSQINGASGLTKSESHIHQLAPIHKSWLGKIIQMSSGGGQNFLVCADGTLWGAGSNESGQLGLGRKRRQIRSYILIDTLPKPVQYIASGVYHSLVLLKDGSLWVTGYNGQGQLGLGTTETQFVFTQVLSLPYDKKIVSLCATEWSSMVVLSDGSFWAAGFNKKSHLGLPEEINYLHFTQVTNNLLDKRVIKAKSRGYHTLLLLEDNSLMGVGSNNVGQLGLAQISHKIISFVPITTFPQTYTVLDFAIGGDFSFVILNDGSLWSTGMNLFGQLGLGAESHYIISFARVSFSEDAGGVFAVSAGTNHTLILLANDKLLGAGNNDRGEIGLGSIGCSNTFIPVTTPSVERTVPPYKKVASLQSMALKQYRDKLTISPYEPDAFLKIVSQTNESIAAEIFMPHLFGCRVCKRYVKPTVWGQCPYPHARPSTPPPAMDAAAANASATSAVSTQLGKASSVGLASDGVDPAEGTKG